MTFNSRDGSLGGIRIREDFLQQGRELGRNLNEGGFSTAGTGVRDEFALGRIYNSRDWS